MFLAWPPKILQASLKSEAKSIETSVDQSRKNVRWGIYARTYRTLSLPTMYETFHITQVSSCM